MPTSSRMGGIGRGREVLRPGIPGEGDPVHELHHGRAIAHRAAHPAARRHRALRHRGEDRAVSRSIFAPIAVAMMSVTAATQVAGPGWDQNFGLGGLFGDTVLGALLGVVPASVSVPPPSFTRLLSDWR